MEKLILCIYYVDTLNKCMDEFGSKLFFDIMTAKRRTSRFFPNKACVYAYNVDGTLMGRSTPTIPFNGGI